MQPPAETDFVPRAAQTVKKAGLDRANCCRYVTVADNQMDLNRRVRKNRSILTHAKEMIDPWPLRDKNSNNTQFCWLLTWSACP
jgi:hypothetical protein